MNRVIEQLERACLFGSPTTVATPFSLRVMSWNDAFDERRAYRWESCIHEALNSIWRSLPSNLNSNPVVIELGAQVDALLARPEIWTLVPNALLDRVKKCVRRDFVRAALEEHYSSLCTTPTFYRRLLSVYLAGCFPCDWEGFILDGHPWVLPMSEVHSPTAVERTQTTVVVEQRPLASRVFFAEQLWQYQTMSWGPAFELLEGWLALLEHKRAEIGVTSLRNVLCSVDHASTFYEAITRFHPELSSYQREALAHAANIILASADVVDSVESSGGTSAEFFRSLRRVYQSGHVPIDWAGEVDLPVVA